MASIYPLHRRSGPSGRDSLARRHRPIAARAPLLRRQLSRLLLGLAIGLLLSACGSFETRDGAPDRHVDLGNIPDAVPKVEPYSKYGNPGSYEVAGQRYSILKSTRGYRARGHASWYGTKFHGRRTSSGEPYDMYAMTAAHKTLPIPSYVEVTNLDNGRKAIVRVNDRGPFVDGRIIDLSYVAARKLGVYGTGTARVEVRAIDPRKPAAAPAQATPQKTNDSSHYYLQVGAFSERDNAEQLLSRLLPHTDENVLIRRSQNSEQPVYRVRIGPLDSEQEARRLEQQLSPHGVDAAHIVLE